MKFIGLILLIYLIYKLIWFFGSSSSLKKKMKHLGILILVYISLWLLFFIHTLILKQNCLWDLDDKIESVKIDLEEPDLSKDVRPLIERQLKKLIEERETDDLLDFETLLNSGWFDMSRRCYKESWGRERDFWVFILVPFSLDIYL